MSHMAIEPVSKHPNWVSAQAAVLISSHWRVIKAICAQTHDFAVHWAAHNATKHQTMCEWKKRSEEVKRGIRPFSICSTPTRYLVTWSHMRLWAWSGTSFFSMDAECRVLATTSRRCAAVAVQQDLISNPLKTVRFAKKSHCDFLEIQRCRRRVGFRANRTVFNGLRLKPNTCRVFDDNEGR